MKNGIELITEERIEQIEKHGMNVDHDSQHGDCQLVEASQAILDYCNCCSWPDGWDQSMLEHINSKPRVEQLAIAGAFIAAEIDRVQTESLSNAQTDK